MLGVLGDLRHAAVGLLRRLVRLVHLLGVVVLLRDLVLLSELRMFVVPVALLPTVQPLLARRVTKRYRVEVVASV